MTEKRKMAWRPGILLGVLSFLTLGIAGVFSPLIRHALIDFGCIENWRCRVMLPVHWVWTIPLGLGVLVGLILAAKRTSRFAYRLLASLAGILLILSWTFLIFLFSFTIRGPTISGPLAIGH